MRNRAWSVLIASVGRESLVTLCNSILTDSEGLDFRPRIFVALNGTEPLGLRELETDVEVLKISSMPIGVGNAMNMGLEKVPDGLVWTIADDDDWLQGKLAYDAGLMADLGSECVLLPKVRYRDERSLVHTIRPRIAIQPGESVLSYLYGRPTFWRNPRFITLSGSVAERSVWQDFPFGTAGVREDIDQLNEMQKSGIKLIVGEVVSVQINVALARGAQRDPSSDAIEWSIKNLTQWESVWFLGTRWTKPRVSVGDSQGILDMIRATRGKVLLNWIPRTTLFTLLYLSLVSVKFSRIGKVKNVVK